MSLAEQVLAFLAGLPEGATDRQIFDAVGAKYYQQINARCRLLAEKGLIERREVDGVIRNFHKNLSPGTAEARAEPAIPDKKWYWEGNVQAKTVRHLVQLGWDITRVADTASKEPGKDIIATLKGKRLWVSVKGRPEGTPRTNASTQARHWFESAIFDLICWRGDDPEAQLALAVPEYGTYRNLANRVRWLLSTLDSQIFWVQEDGTCGIE